MASAIHIKGDGNELVTIGAHTYYRHELMSAFGGTLSPDRLAPYPKRQFGNAAALGLFSFALSTFTLGLYLAGAKHIKSVNVAVGLCFWYGGLVEACAGVWELVAGNCFAGTVLVSFGAGFWVSFGAINVPRFGITAAYGDDTAQLNNALGLYLLGWGIFTFVMLLLTLKSTLAFAMLFATLDTAFFVLAGFYFSGRPALQTAGGVLCVVSAICGWVCAYAGVATPHTAYWAPSAIALPATS